MSHLFTRDGHLRDAAIDAALRGALPDSDQSALEAHASACVACNARIDGMRADLYEVQAARSAPALDAAEPSPAPWARTAAAAGLAGIALVTGLWWFTQAPTARQSSTGLTLEVVRYGESAPLAPDAQLRGGDRIGFRVASNTDGYLLIVGVDSDGSTYPCFPSANDLATLVRATPTPVPLDAAVHIEGDAERERIVAIRCPTTFEVADVVGALAAAHDQPTLPPLRAGCAQTDVTLAEVER